MQSFVRPIAAETEPEPRLLGQKGAGLVIMRRLGLPVPPGVILTTELYAAVHRELREQGGAWIGLSDALWDHLWSELGPSLDSLAQGRPRLLAVRSGAAVSMPGMLDSILNLGLGAEAAESLAAWSGSRRFALDCYRRFLRQYAQVVLGLRAPGLPGFAPADPFTSAGPGLRSRRAAGDSSDPEVAALSAECQSLLDEIRQRGGAVPEDPNVQLRAAIGAVLRSVLLPRAREYRRLHSADASDIPGASDGTAVVIQSMVFGNRGERSATGVLFTRDPSTGEPIPYGEYLPCAQGEDVVAGVSMPRPLAELGERMPDAYAALIAAGSLLERHRGDLQDIEFTIEEGTLFLLQTRTGKRSGRAMVRIACDLCREGHLSPEAALSRVEPARLGELLHSTIDPQIPRTLLVRGLPASPGVATGRIALSVAEVERQGREGRAAILVRADTSPDDIRGIKLAAGVLTSRGGMTSHAAVVARGLGRSAVVGASQLSIDAARGTVSTREHTARQGDAITVDGNSGEVLLGEVARSVGHLRLDPHLAEVRGWAQKRRRLRVYALADTALDAALGEQMGADGVILRRRFTVPSAALVVLSLTSAGPPSTHALGLELADAAALDAALPGCDLLLLPPERSAAELKTLVEAARLQRPDVQLGLFAQGGSGDAALVGQAQGLGLDYVACPPLRLPIVELLAAQAVAASHP